MVLLIVLPGAPRQAEQLHLRLRAVADEREVLVAVLVDLRRAHHHVAPARPDTSNIVRYGFHASTTFSGVVDADGHVVARRAAPRRRSSPGRARSVARARRPPIIGMVPIGLARISPSPRKHSATRDDAHVGPGDELARRRCSQPDHLPVLGVVAAVEVLRLPRRPTPPASSRSPAYSFWNASSRP